MINHYEKLKTCSVFDKNLYQILLFELDLLQSRKQRFVRVRECLPGNRRSLRKIFYTFVVDPLLCTDGPHVRPF